MDFLKKSRGLFKPKAADPAFLERQGRARAALLKNLSRAVKENQLLFTRSEHGVVGDCRQAQRLCARFEEVLRHGLKERWFGVSPRVPTFWPVVMKISRKQAIDYINHLQYAQSDDGRCRAWIRLAVNESSLESYITVLCQDSQLLGQFYEDHSFLRDDEICTALKQLLTGLSQIAFNITVDTASLEFSPAPEALQPALKLRASLPVHHSSSEQLLGAPSTSSTPQPSSSGDSWLTTSSESNHSIDSLSLTAAEEHPTHLEEHPTYLEEHSTHFEEHPTHFEEQPTHLKEHPSHFKEHPSHLEEEDEICSEPETPSQSTSVGMSSIQLSSDVPVEVAESKGEMEMEEKDEEEVEAVVMVAREEEEVEKVENEEKTSFREQPKTDSSQQSEARDSSLNVNEGRPYKWEEASSEEITFSEVLRLAQGVQTDQSIEPDLTVEHCLPPPHSPPPPPPPPPQARYPSTNPFSLQESMNGSSSCRTPVVQLPTNPFASDAVPSNPFSPSTPNPFCSNPFSMDQQQEEEEEEKWKTQGYVEEEEEEEEEGELQLRDIGNVDPFYLTSEDFVVLELPAVEDYYPQEMTVGTAEQHISHLKARIKEQSDNDKLKQALVKFQLLLQEMKELQEEHPSGVEEVCGHRFIRPDRPLRGGRCDTCSKPLLFRMCVQCTGCSYISHRKCLHLVTRQCLTQVLKESPTYCLEVCPEKGLTQQHFRCSSCNRAFNQQPTTEVRLCDYTGLYHCSRCHSNTLTVMPARVLHNWDFTVHRVCCGCAELLASLHTRPLISVQNINPALYSYVGDLAEVETLRCNLLMMKPILASCTRAKEERLLQELDNWPHFKDSAHLFSLSDLKELHTGTLLPQLQTIHSMFLSHIRSECEACLGQGQVCAVCGSPDVLFPFDKNITTCSKCLAVFHRECQQSALPCPHCVPPARKQTIHLSQI